MWILKTLALELSTNFEVFYVSTKEASSYVYSLV